MLRFFWVREWLNLFSMDFFDCLCYLILEVMVIWGILFIFLLCYYLCVFRDFFFFFYCVDCFFCLFLVNWCMVIVGVGEEDEEEEDIE